MTLQSNGYNWLAPCYDQLARVFVGSQIHQMQLKLLHHLQGRKKLLILGGGTGWILPHIFQVNPGLVIHYVDISERMISRARRKAGANKQVHFFVGTETAIPAQDYDAVLTHFYLDLFTNTRLAKVITTIKQHLAGDARWLVSDFETQTYWQRLKIKTMYLFFRIVTGLPTSSLPGWFLLLTEAGCIALENQHTQDKFIRSVVFQVRPNVSYDRPVRS